MSSQPGPGADTISPAFGSNKQAIGFCCLTLGLLFLPVLLKWAGPPPRWEVYQGVTLESGPFAFNGRQIFEEKSALDVAFVCSSLLWKGFDTPYFQRELSRALGREANVVMIGSNWQGMDLQYVMLRDLLEHRKVRMLVTAMPIPQVDSDRPHVQLFRWLRFGEFPEVIAGLPLRSRLTLYADFVLGAPRQLLTLLRPNLVDPAKAMSASFGGRSEEMGYYGAPFVSEPADPPPLAPEDVIYSPRTAAVFDFNGRPLGPYQRHFAESIGELARNYGVRLVLIHVPVASERGQNVIRERMFWPDVLGTPATIIGVPSGTLFRNIPGDRFYRYYFDEHLNANGNRLFTRAITPALIRTYVQPAR